MTAVWKKAVVVWCTGKWGYSCRHSKLWHQDAGHPIIYSSNSLLFILLCYQYI